MVHKNGVMIECDLFGQYVDIVIDMGPESGNNYEFEICSLAILGSTIEYTYEREGTVPDAIEVIRGGFLVSFSIEHIYPVPEVAGFVAGLRQKSGAELSFVSLD